MMDQSQSNEQKATPWLKCFCSVLVYRPWPTKPDCRTIGFVLVEPNPERPRIAVRFEPKLEVVQALDPEIDIEVLESTLLDLESDLTSIVKNVTDAYRVRHAFPENFPEELELLPSNAVLTKDFNEEVKLQAQYLFQANRQDKSDKQADLAGYSGRGQLFLKRKMRDRFVAFGVWEHLDKNIAIDEYTVADDPHKIACAYVDPRQRIYRMFDPISVFNNSERAKSLALSAEKIRSGIRQKEGMPCEILALVETETKGNMEAERAINWMNDAGIRVNPISAMEALAADARIALQL